MLLKNFYAKAGKYACAYALALCGLVSFSAHSMPMIDLPPLGVDMEISIVDLNDPVAFGTPIDYQISVTNNGPQNAIDVRFGVATDSPGTILGSDFIDGPAGTCDPLVSLVGLVCQINLIINQDVSILALSFLPDNPGEILQTAFVSSSLGDANEQNNIDTELTRYLGPVSAVPIPPTMWLFGLMLPGLIGFRPGNDLKRS